MTISNLSVLSGVIGTIIVLAITLIRQKRLDPSDFYSFIAAFFSASNIPPAIFLIWYVFNSEPEFAKTTLKEQEKYIAMAGIALFLACLIALWKLCSTAWLTEASNQTEDSE